MSSIVQFAEMWHLFYMFDLLIEQVEWYRCMYVHMHYAVLNCCTIIGVLNHRLFPQNHLQSQHKNSHKSVKTQPNFTTTIANKFTSYNPNTKTTVKPRQLRLNEQHLKCCNSLNSWWNKIIFFFKQLYMYLVFIHYYTFCVG